MSTRMLICSTILATLLGGCASAPDRVLSTERPVYATLPNGRDPMNPSQFIPDAELAAAGSRSADSVEEGVLRFFETVHGRPLQILELSGGGQNGAFGAGVLKGWSESGTRPQFDVVTGVSTGALLSTHAFLGTPADDATLEALFTGVSASDIYTENGLAGVAFGDVSLLDTTPFKALIEKHITAEVIRRVAAEYDKGRRLLVATTNLDYDQTWVWNLTLLAKMALPGHEDVYRSVLRASASPPVAFPPVVIDGHLFADGSVRSNLLVMGLAGTHRPPPPLYGPGDIYVLHNGRLERRPEALKQTFASVAGSTVGASMDASMGQVLLRSYFATRAWDYNYHETSIPEDADIGKNPLAFDPAQMRAGFDAGYEIGKRGAWRDSPPHLSDVPDWSLKVLDSLGQ